MTAFAMDCATLKLPLFLSLLLCVMKEFLQFIHALTNPSLLAVCLVVVFITFLLDCIDILSKYYLG